jgi:hypothetical protein
LSCIATASSIHTALSVPPQPLFRHGKREFCARPPSASAAPSCPRVFHPTQRVACKGSRATVAANSRVAREDRRVSHRRRSAGTPRVPPGVRGLAMPNAAIKLRLQMVQRVVTGSGLIGTHSPGIREACGTPVAAARERLGSLSRAPPARRTRTGCRGFHRQHHEPRLP